MKLQILDKSCYLGGISGHSYSGAGIVVGCFCENWSLFLRRQANRPIIGIRRNELFAEHEVPVAYSMIELARVSKQPIQEYMAYWIAFNNIYVKLAEAQGLGPRLRIDQDKTIRTRPNGSAQIPDVSLPLSEKEQIELAFDRFDSRFKRILLDHPSFLFFAFRTPRWHGRRIGFDASGQKVNGVINVGYTSSVKYPVWSPIEVPAIERFVAGRLEKGDRDLLAKQLLFVLYTVRNNIFHRGKQVDDANDREVVENALPLLKIVVEYFLHEKY